MTQATLTFENSWEFSEILDGDDPDYIVVEAGEWEQDSKYQSCTTVVQHVPTGKYYMGHESRSGSPFTDWEYDTDPILYEVARVEETRVVVTWKPVLQA